MDPDAAFYEMAEAVAHAEWTEAKERAKDLRHWLETGGFAPKITGHDQFDRIAAKAACNAVLQR